MGEDSPRCRQCGEPLRTRLVATASLHTCLTNTAILGASTPDGPLGSQHLRALDETGDSSID
jgi:hypothetical protein